MRKRWTAAGMLVAEQQFRRIIGYRDLAKLVIAIERHADRVKPTTATTVTYTQVSEVVLSVCLTLNHTWRPPPKFHDESHILARPARAGIASCHWRLQA